jgi:hypothetical protein
VAHIAVVGGYRLCSVGGLVGRDQGRHDVEFSPPLRLVFFGWPGLLVARVRVETFHTHRRSAGDARIPVTSCALAMPRSRTRTTSCPGHLEMPRRYGDRYFRSRRRERMAFCGKTGQAQAYAPFPAGGRGAVSSGLTPRWTI